jgi:hypothetical protein
MRNAFATFVGVVFFMVFVAVGHAALVGAFEGNVVLMVTVAALLIAGIFAAYRLESRDR